MNLLRFSPAFKISLIYLISGILWISLSDHFLLQILSSFNLEEVLYYQTIKGVIYVILTSQLLYFLIQSFYSRISEKVNDLKIANKILQRQTSELKSINADLEQFNYVASHDLQEPLRSITTFMTLLQKKYDQQLDEQGRKYMNLCVSAASRMRQLVLDLLEYSRSGISIEKSEEVVFLDLIDELSAVFSSELDKCQGVIVCETPITLDTNRTALLHILQNLIGNAIKYRKRDVPVEIKVAAESNNDHWLVSVEDNGIGIESQYFQKIFVIFQRLHTNADFSGTGIGLAIAKKIVGNLGGEIKVTSEKNIGSVFSFTISKH